MHFSLEPLCLHRLPCVSLLIQPVYDLPLDLPPWDLETAILSFTCNLQFLLPVSCMLCMILHL